VKRAVVATTPDGLRDALERYADRGLRVAVDAGNQAAWIVDLLRELGAKVHVVHPLKVKWIAQARKNRSHRRPALGAPAAD
jgi:transposase